MARAGAMTGLGGDSCDARSCAVNTSSRCLTSAARAIIKRPWSVRRGSPGTFEIAPFSALHRIVDGLIMAAHHYLTDADVLARLGLV